MEDGLGAAHREETPLGCDGSARDSVRVSAGSACTCEGHSREAVMNQGGNTKFLCSRPLNRTVYGRELFYCMKFLLHEKVGKRDG